MINTLKPPTVIKQGDLTQQYFPQPLDQDAVMALLLSQVIHNPGMVLEYAQDRVEAAVQAVSGGEYQIILWVPAKKTSMGDIAFIAPGQIEFADGPRYIQLVYTPKPQVIEATGPQLVQ